MKLIDFVSLPLWLNIGVFAAAGVVWFAGVRLTSYAKAIAERTGAEQASVGILLLGAIVSLPEMATTVAAAAAGQAQLAVNMLLGILLTGVYLAGFVERRHKTMLRMGIDSVIVLLAYAGGLVLLFSLR